MTKRLILTPLFLLYIAAGPATRPAEKIDDSFSPDTLRLSANSSHYSHIRRTNFLLVPIIDGAPQQPAEWIINSRVDLSNDGAHSLYAVRSRDGSRFIHDNTPGPWWETLEDTRFTSTGQSLVIGRNKNQSILYHNAQLVGMFPKARIAGLSNASFAYISYTPDDLQTLVVNDSQFGPFLHVGEVRFSNARWACRVTSDDASSILDSGKPGPKFNQVSNPVFSADGQHLAYTAVRNEQSYFILDDKEFVLLPFPAELAEPVLNPDASRWAATLQMGNKRLLYIDNTSAGSFNRVGQLLFSKDGTRLIYAATNDKNLWRVNLDGKPVGPECAWVYELLFSPDSKRAAWTCDISGKDQIFIDSQSVGTFDTILPGVLNFSPDSQHWVCVTGKPGDQSILVDGKPVVTYPRIFLNSPAHIDEPNTLRGLAMKDNDLFWFDLPLE